MEMINRSFVVLALSALFSAATSQLHGQALPTASRTGILQAGFGVTNAQSDEFDPRISGITGYATFDFRKHLGLEADIHMLNIITPQDFAERTYLAGARYVWHRGRLDPYVKVLGGIGQTYIQQPSSNFADDTPSTHIAIAAAGGLDLRLPHHINVRAIDFEYQTWPKFGLSGLSPTLITCGVAYRFN
jgi:hypothetical protein